MVKLVFFYATHRHIEHIVFLQKIDNQCITHNTMCSMYLCVAKKKTNLFFTLYLIFQISNFKKAADVPSF